MATAGTAAGTGSEGQSVPSSPASSRRPVLRSKTAAVHDQDAQQLPYPDSASGGAKVASHAAAAGQHGVLSKKPSKARKQSSPAGPPSGINFWLQIRQAAAGKPVEQSKAARTQQVAIHVPGKMPASALGPACEAKTHERTGQAQPTCPAARHDTPPDCDRLGRGHQAAKGYKPAQQHDSPWDHKEDIPAIEQPMDADADGDDPDSSSESSQEMLALNKNGHQHAPSHVEVSHIEQALHSDM